MSRLRGLEGPKLYNEDPRHRVNRLTRILCTKKKSLNMEDPTPVQPLQIFKEKQQNILIQDDNLVSKQRKRLLKAPYTSISTKHGEDFHKSIKADSLDVAF